MLRTMVTKNFAQYRCPSNNILTYFYANILDELYEMIKVLETYNLARLHHEVIANLNRPILSKSFNQKSKEK